jgi:superfamily I DNA/RNA helicase
VFTVQKGCIATAAWLLQLLSDLSADGNQGSVEALLLGEAQEEIASLRSELYGTRRVAEERRQANEALTRARDELTAQAGQLQERLG